MKSWTACERFGKAFKTLERFVWNRFGKAFKTLEKVWLEQVWKSLAGGRGLEKPLHGKDLEKSGIHSLWT